MPILPAGIVIKHSLITDTANGTLYSAFGVLQIKSDSTLDVFRNLMAIRTGRGRSCASLNLLSYLDYFQMVEGVNGELAK